jgi:hypothetical protein
MSFSSNRNFLPKISTKPQTVEGSRLPLTNKSRIDFGRKSLNYSIQPVQPDPSTYIYIQDPKLRHMVLLLISSESKRKIQNLDANFLTKINHSK